MSRRFVDVLERLIDIVEPHKEGFLGLYEELKALKEGIFLIAPETEIDYWHKLQNIINYYFDDAKSYDDLFDWQVDFVKAVRGEEDE